MSVSALQEQVLQVLVEHQAPMSLAQVAEALGRTKSPTNRVLLQLVRAGRVVQIGSHPNLRFGLLSWTQVEWLEQTGDAAAKRWIRAKWAGPGPIDWRFPLVARIRDEKARDVVGAFLRRAWEAGYFTPWLVDYLDVAVDRHNLDWARLDADRRRRLLRDPKNHGAVTVIVFGSTARGDARRDSDVDVLVLTPLDPGPQQVPQFPYADRFGDLADAINLGASRPIDLIVASEDELYDRVKGLPQGLARSIAMDGITVYTTESTGFGYVERWGKDVPEWRAEAA